MVPSPPFSPPQMQAPTAWPLWTMASSISNRSCSLPADGLCSNSLSARLFLSQTSPGGLYCPRVGGSLKLKKKKALESRDLLVNCLAWNHHCLSRLFRFAYLYQGSQVPHLQKIGPKPLFILCLCVFNP